MIHLTNANKKRLPSLILPSSMTTTIAIQFAWTHVTLLIFVTQSYLIIQNLFEGLIWFIVPVSMIICNDVMAYVFGTICGKTPLIKLSPKKTWEGFIGGGLSTIVLGGIVSTQQITTCLSIKSQFLSTNIKNTLKTIVITLYVPV